MIYPAGLDAEEKRLMARVEELARMAAMGKRDACFTAFLSEHQQALAQLVLQRSCPVEQLFYGGYPGAERKMVGLFSAWVQLDEAVFPIVVLDIHLPRGAVVSHRDVLGSLMALQVGRETIGDILTEPENRICHVFLQKSIAPFACASLDRIGRYGVHCSLVEPGEGYTRREILQPVHGTVQSARIDALVSLLTGLSREKGAALIHAEKVQCNAMPVRSLSGSFAPGDVITIRGYGKYRVEELGMPTKKGRLPVRCSRFGG